MVLEQVAPDLLLADFGVSVTAGAISGIGVLDQNSQISLQGQIIMVNYALTCRTDVFGQLQHGAAITIAGEVYEVDHEPIRIADGVYCVIPLERLQGYQGELTDIILDGGDATSDSDIIYTGGGA